MAEPERSIPLALYRDPPVDRAWPAQTLPYAIASHGFNLNAILYTAAGRGPHRTILLLHGLPGNEQNVDLAQSLRRAGCNVLTIHYRGSWGGPGSFSFRHCLEDAAAALDWLRDPARAPAADPAARIDRDRIAAIGHSMGGFVAADLCAARPEMRGAALISAADLGVAFGRGDPDQAIATVDANVGVGAGLHILAGTSPGSLAQEARHNADRWRLTNYAAALADRPLLIVTADDGFAPGGQLLAAAVARAAGARLATAHFPTDHSYSDCRLALQARILDWLTLIG